jgi:hypothetical protein
MKKFISIIIGLAILGGLVIYHSSSVNAIAPVVDVRTNADATTTAPYLVAAAASSTLAAFSLDSVSAIQLFVWSAASTTATKFTATVEYSNNLVDWYPFTSASSSLVSAGSGVSPVIEWTPGTASSSKTIFITGPNNYAARYGRVKYQLIGANGQIYLEAALKRSN